MNLHWLLVIIGLIAVLLYFFPNIDPVMKKILYFIAIVATIVWFLGITGLWIGTGFR